MGLAFVVTNPDQTAKLDEVPGDYGRISIGEAAGWADLRASIPRACRADPPPGERAR